MVDFLSFWIRVQFVGAFFIIGALYIYDTHKSWQVLSPSAISWVQTTTHARIESIKTKTENTIHYDLPFLAPNGSALSFICAPDSIVVNARLNDKIQMPNGDFVTQIQSSQKGSFISFTAVWEPYCCSQDFPDPECGLTWFARFEGNWKGSWK